MRLLYFYLTLVLLTFGIGNATAQGVTVLTLDQFKQLSVAEMEQAVINPNTYSIIDGSGKAVDHDVVMEHFLPRLEAERKRVSANDPVKHTEASPAGNHQPTMSSDGEISNKIEYLRKEGFSEPQIDAMIHGTGGAGQVEPVKPVEQPGGQRANEALHYNGPSSDAAGSTGTHAPAAGKAPSGGKVHITREKLNNMSEDERHDFEHNRSKYILVDDK
jgi:hypothetical protein